MVLHTTTEPDRIIDKILKSVKRHKDDKSSTTLSSLPYSSRYATEDVPKFELPEESSDAGNVYQLIHDELEMDDKPTLNCASFVSTWMEPEAHRLIQENLYKNLADQDEYPALQVLHARCVSIISHLWAIPSDCKAIGTATVGSSEAVMLGGLAMKRRWEERRKKEGKDIDRPNIILSSCAQVALEKFGNYFSVEGRLVPVSAASHYVMDPRKAVELVDERTVGIYAIMGSTYTGHYEPIEQLSKLLDNLQKEKGWDVPIHVDAASGGFVAPFTNNAPKWCFNVPRVVSINASGHKFGLCYPGVGWVLWKREEYLPKSLIFELHYLGGAEKTYTLNFSRPSCFVIAQYYNFTRLGRAGYRAIISACLRNARLLSCALEGTGNFEVLSDVHRKKGVFEGPGTMDGEAANAGLPVVSFRFSKEAREVFGEGGAGQYAISGLLKTRGWSIPNYALPKDESSTYILRVVVRESMTEDVIETFIRDISWVVNLLSKACKGDDRSFLDLFASVAGSSPEADAEEKAEEDQVKIQKPNTYARVC